MNQRNTEHENAAEKAKEELEQLELSDVQTESLWTSILYAYIRDQALIRYYRLQCERNENNSCELEDIFQSNFAECFRLSLGHYGLDKDAPALFYSGEGDFITQIARLFLLCKEKRGSISLDYDRINSDIAQLSLPNFYVKNDDYIKCLRDAIAHFRFKINIDEENPEKTTVTFLDVLIRGNTPKEITGKAVLTNAELSSILEVVVKAVCERLGTMYGRQH